MNYWSITAAMSSRKKKVLAKQKKGKERMKRSAKSTSAEAFAVMLKRD